MRRRISSGEKSVASTDTPWPNQSSAWAQPSLSEIAADVARPAAEVHDTAAAPDAGGEAVEHLAVEGLALELGEVLLGVGARDPVVRPGEIGIPPSFAHG